jgi:hypothetical protein
MREVRKIISVECERVDLERSVKVKEKEDVY